MEWKYKMRDQNRWHPLSAQTAYPIWSYEVLFESLCQYNLSHQRDLQNSCPTLINSLLKSELLLFCWNHKNADFCYLKREIQKSHWWLKFYSNELQNITSYEHIGPAVWAVEGGAIDFPSSSYIVILSVVAISGLLYIVLCTISFLSFYSNLESSNAQWWFTLHSYPQRLSSSANYFVDRTDPEVIVNPHGFRSNVTVNQSINQSINPSDTHFFL